MFVFFFCNPLFLYHPEAPVKTNQLMFCNPSFCVISLTRRYVFLQGFIFPIFFFCNPKPPGKIARAGGPCGPASPRLRTPTPPPETSSQLRTPLFFYNLLFLFTTRRSPALGSLAMFCFTIPLLFHSLLSVFTTRRSPQASRFFFYNP